MQKQPKVVVVGAGFGGMQAAQSLGSLGLETLLIDRNNYNAFVPLLYQVAAAQVEPEKIAYPLRNVVRRSRNTRFLMAEVKHINVASQVIETDNGVISYDFLVLATGSKTQFLNIPGAAQYAFSLRNLDEAIAIRNHIFQCFEQASRETDPNRRRQLLTFVIVGGGPTGTEMAGALVELKQVLQRDYPDLNTEDIKIILIQSSPLLLADLPASLGYYTARKLRKIGVDVYLQSRVDQVTPRGIRLNSGETFAAATVIWTAGMEAASPALSAPINTAAKGKLVVQPTLQLESHPNVYVIGDLAYVLNGSKPLTGVAPEALQQGVVVASNIKRQIDGKIPKSFNYFNKGRLAIIGCYSGVGKIGPILITGFLPWLMWLMVHLVYLPGFRNRLLVLLSWLHSYFFRDRAIRLILAQAATDRATAQKRPELRV